MIDKRMKGRDNEVVLMSGLWKALPSFPSNRNFRIYLYPEISFAWSFKECKNVQFLSLP